MSVCGKCGCKLEKRQYFNSLSMEYSEPVYFCPVCQKHYPCNGTGVVEGKNRSEIGNDTSKSVGMSEAEKCSYAILSDIQEKYQDIDVEQLTEMADVMIDKIKTAKLLAFEEVEKAIDTLIENSIKDCGYEDSNLIYAKKQISKLKEGL